MHDELKNRYWIETTRKYPHEPKVAKERERKNHQGFEKTDAPTVSNVQVNGLRAELSDLSLSLPYCFLLIDRSS